MKARGPVVARAPEIECDKFSIPKIFSSRGIHPSGEGWLKCWLPNFAIDGLFPKINLSGAKFCCEGEDESNCRKPHGQSHKNGAVRKTLVRKFADSEQVKEYMKCP